MSTDIERAEMVAKQAITEALNESCCDKCGMNPRNASDYQRVAAQYQRSQTDLRKALAASAWWQHVASQRPLDRSDKWAGAQAKIKRQRQALATMYIEVQHLRSELRKKECDTPTSSES